MFGRGKDKNEPIPEKVQLTGKGQDSQEIKLSKLTEEVLKEDIGFIRMFYEKLTEVLNEKLSLLDGISKSQQHLDEVLNKFGLSQDRLVTANVNVLSEIRKFAADQGANNAQVINTLVKAIDSLNLIIESQNQIIARLGNPSAELSENKIEKVELAEPEPEQIVPAVQKTTSEIESSDLTSPNEVFLSDDRTAETPTNSGDGQTGQPTDSTQFAEQLLEDIKNRIFSVVDPDAKIQSRFAENIPGIQFNEIWILALPPKTDGKYDSSVMQDTAFKKIKTLLPKNKKETVVAVYRGEISEKKLIGANRVADDFKIILTNFSEINKVLARATVVETRAESQA